MRSKPLVLFTLLLLATFGVSAAWAQSTGANDNGTKLTAVTGAIYAADCNPDGTRTVTVPWTVTSTAAADAAVLSVVLDGGAEAAFGTIASGNVLDDPPGGWSFSGRTKIATGEYTLNLLPGDHTIAICATQDGANGRLPKRDCSEDFEFTVPTCELPLTTCQQFTPFGQLVGNPNFCKVPSIEVQAKGDFGNPATLTVTMNGVTLKSADINRSGDSCVYHYNWANPQVRRKGDTWIFTISGAGNSVTFSKTCN